MKRKLIALLAIVALCVLMLPACTASAEGSIKTITKPYIAQYECVKAKCGDTDLLENFDYVRIILADDEELEVVVKPKGEEKQITKGTYALNPETRELTGEIGILGYKYREKVIVKNGRFTISKNIGGKEFYAEFKVI